jgi:hypothetical protein
MLLIPRRIDDDERRAEFRQGIFGDITPEYPRVQRSYCEGIGGHGIDVKQDPLTREASFNGGAQHTWSAE